MTKQTWVITDTHFYHAAMVYLCHRPDDFGEQIIANWKRLVQPEDTVIHLGDVAWKDITINKLPGRKILVRGNHDSKTDTWYMENGFDFVCNSFTLNRYGVNALFTHKPELFHSYDINICGHTHGLLKINSPCAILDLSLEKYGYKPWLLSEVMNMARKIVDSHKEKNLNPDISDSIKIYPNAFDWDRAAYNVLKQSIPKYDTRAKGIRDFDKGGGK